MQASLSALLDHLRRHPYRAGRHLAHAPGQHVGDSIVAAEQALGGLVRAEEEGGAGGGPDDGGPDAPVDSREAARGEEAGRRLEAGLERVEREQGEVDCGAGEAAGEEGGLEGGRGGGHCCLFSLHSYRLESGSRVGREKANGLWRQRIDALFLVSGRVVEGWEARATN